MSHAIDGSLPYDLAGRLRSQEETKAWLKDRKQEWLDRDKIMEVINKQLEYYEELESRNGLTELGKHAKLAIQNLKSDIEYALSCTDPLRMP